MHSHLSSKDQLFFKQALFLCFHLISENLRTDCWGQDLKYYSCIILEFSRNFTCKRAGPDVALGKLLNRFMIVGRFPVSSNLSASSKTKNFTWSNFRSPDFTKSIIRPICKDLNFILGTHGLGINYSKWVMCFFLDSLDLRVCALKNLQLPYAQVCWASPCNRNIKYKPYTVNKMYFTATSTGFTKISMSWVKILQMKKHKAVAQNLGQVGFQSEIYLVSQ